MRMEAAEEEVGEGRGGGVGCWRAGWSTRWWGGAGQRSGVVWWCWEWRTGGWISGVWIKRQDCCARAWMQSQGRPWFILQAEHRGITHSSACGQIVSCAVACVPVYAQLRALTSTCRWKRGGAEEGVEEG
jgi:hypothetical protein